MRLCPNQFFKKIYLNQWAQWDFASLLCPRNYKHTVLSQLLYASAWLHSCSSAPATSWMASLNNNSTVPTMTYRHVTLTQGFPLSLFSVTQCSSHKSRSIRKLSTQAATRLYSSCIDGFLIFLFSFSVLKKLEEKVCHLLYCMKQLTSTHRTDWTLVTTLFILHWNKTNSNISFSEVSV